VLCAVRHTTPGTSRSFLPSSISHPRTMIDARMVAGHDRGDASRRRDGHRRSNSRCPHRATCWSTCRRGTRRSPRLADTQNVLRPLNLSAASASEETAMIRFVMIGAVAGLAILPAWLMAQTAPPGRGNAGTTRRSCEKFTVEGQPIDRRPPELDTDHPVFPGQTHAPYHKTTDVAVTTIA